MLVASALLAGPTRADLVSHFTFDYPGALGQDAGSFANHATPASQARFSGDSKVGGGALLLDGNADYLDIGRPGDYSGLDDNDSGFTVAAWVNPASLSGVRRVFSTGMFSGFTADGWRCGFSGASPFATTYGVKDFNADAELLTVGSWSHLAYVYRPAQGEMRFYENGALVATKTGSAGMRTTTTFTLRAMAGTTVTTREIIIGVDASPASPSSSPPTWPDSPTRTGTPRTGSRSAIPTPTTSTSRDGTSPMTPSMPRNGPSRTSASFRGNTWLCSPPTRTGMWQEANSTFVSGGIVRSS